MTLLTPKQGFNVSDYLQVEYRYFKNKNNITKKMVLGTKLL